MGGAQRTAGDKAGLPDRVTIYHSHLRKACEAAPQGEVEVVLTGRRARVLDSSHRDRLPYAPFRLAGESREREYQVENDAVRQALDALPQGERVRIRAAGGPGAETIEVSLAAEGAAPTGAPRPAAAPAPAPARAEAAHQAGPPARRSTGRATNDRGTIEEELWTSLLVSHRLIAAYVKRFGHPPSDEVLRLANAIHIERHKSQGRMRITKRLPTAEDLAPPSTNGGSGGRTRAEEGHVRAR